MKGGRKLKAINGNSVAYLIYEYLIGYLPAYKQKGSFLHLIFQITIKRLSNPAPIINRYAFKIFYKKVIVNLFLTRLALLGLSFFMSLTRLPSSCFNRGDVADKGCVG